MSGISCLLDLVDLPRGGVINPVFIFLECLNFKVRQRRSAKAKDCLDTCSMGGGWPASKCAESRPHGFA